LLRTLQDTLSGSCGRLAWLGGLQVAAAGFEALSIAMMIPFLAAVGSGSAVVALPWSFMARIPPTIDTRVAAGILIGAIGIRTLAQCTAALFWSRSVEYFELRERSRLIESFTAAAWDCQSRQPAGKLQQLLTVNVEQVAKAFTAAAYAMSHALNLSILAMCAFLVSVTNSLAALAMLGCLALIARPLTIAARTAAAQRATAIGSYANLVSQGAALTKEMRIFGVESWFVQGTTLLAKRIGDTRRRQNLLGAVVPAIYQNGSGLLLVAGSAAALYFGTGAQASSLIVSVLLLVRSVSYGQHLHSSYHQLQECVPYLAELHSALQNYAQSRTSAGTRPLDRIRELEFRNVCFAYARNAPALNDVSFSVSAGDMVAVVGRSGAGKSTLAQLILGLREPLSGAVLVNGIERSEILSAAWFSRVAFVPQDLALFGESIAECIRFHREHVSSEQVRLAAERAGIGDDVRRMAAGLETSVGERGAAVSHGQRQRICIARALAGEPDLVVFDEPTSALDAETEQHVLATLRALSRDAMGFIPAHRVATLSACNKVMVLEDGRITAFQEIDHTIAPFDLYRELVGGSAT